MTEKVLIFGVGGQDGQYLGRLLNGLGLAWVGASRGAGQHRGSVADATFVSAAIEAERPSHIFHFAANSVTRHDALMENHAAISTGAINILEAARVHAPEARIFLSGSALQFRNDGSPISEETPKQTTSAYALSREQSLLAARYFRETFGLRTYFGYFFNHDSELRSVRHVNMAIVEAARQIAGGSKERLTLGDPTVRKEFNYAGDMVRSAWMLTNQDALHEAVIGSGETHSIQDWADLCFARVGLRAIDHISVSDSFVPEYRQLVSDPARIKGLGWSPQVDIAGLADIMMGIR